MLVKNAWKGQTRENICRECLIKAFIEFHIEQKEVRKIKKEMMLESLS